MARQEIKNLKVNVVDTKPCSVVLTVEVPHSEVLSETERVYREIQSAAQVPGFRAGKAPMELIRKNYVSTARERIIENLIKITVFSALESQGIEHIDFPQIEEMNFEFDKPLTYRVKAERHPEFQVKNYKGIKIEKKINVIDDAKINEEMEILREKNAKLEESKSETITDKNFVIMDHDCFLDNEPLNEFKAKNQLIDLTSPQTIAGFKEGLIGAKKGEEKEIKIKFPADYPNKKLSGKDVVFKTKVIQIKEKILPELNDQFAVEFGFKDLAELKAKVRESLENEENRRQHEEVEKQIVGHLIKENTFPVPDTLINEQVKYLTAKMANYFKKQGIQDDVLKKSIEENKDKYKQEAETNVRISYILNAVSKAEKIEVSEEDMKAELEKLLKSNPGKETEAEKYFKEHNETIKSHLKEEKIFKFIIDNSKTKEVV